MTEFAQDNPKQNIDNPAVPKVLQWLPGVFLVATVVIGGALAVTSTGARDLPKNQDVVTGKWTHAFETGLDANVPFQPPAMKLWGTINYRLFHEAREGALVGKDGWLYTSEEFQTSDPKLDQANIEAKLQYIQKVQDQLKAQGATLMVVLVPAKVRVYPEHLGSLHVPSVKANLYQEFRGKVLAMGIPTPDLYTALLKAKPQGDVFVRTDTHWSSLGATVAANAVAATVRQISPDLHLPTAEFKTTTVKTGKNVGDLLRYLPGAAPKSATIFVPSSEKIGGANSLLGEDAVAVTLVGTSYSAIKDWNFEGALKQALGSDVLNVADAGQGPIVPMRTYLKSQAIKDAPPKLLIWEIPERFLRFKY